MTDVTRQGNCNLIWEQLLSQNEITCWMNDRNMPQRQPFVAATGKTEVYRSQPGIYRFTFMESNRESSGPKAFYVGESGDLRERLPKYFRRVPVQEKRDAHGEIIVDPGWQVLGAIRNEIRDAVGRCELQLLKIDGFVKICGVTLNENELEKVFARRLLENWAILQSMNDGMRPLNCGLHQGTKDLFRLMRSELGRSMGEGELDDLQNG